MARSDWEGLSHISAASFSEEIKPRAEKVMVQALLLFATAWTRTLGAGGGQRTGRTYKVSKTGRLHTASAPGEPPAVLFGTLRSSITWKDPVWENWTLEGIVGTNVVYARRLEFGGVDSRDVRILPRPHLEPTRLRVDPRLHALFEAGL